MNTKIGTETGIDTGTQGEKRTSRPISAVRTATRNAVIFPIRIYQKYISPRKRYNCCKYYPSCSQYALLAIRNHGILLGLPMALWRVLRCNPFSRGGVDMVPERGFLRSSVQKRLGRLPTAPSGAQKTSESEK